MRRIKTMGLCLVAVFAITALASASASAAPEYFGINSCTKKFQALWNGGQCVTGTYKTTVATPAGTTKIKVSNKAIAGEEGRRVHREKIDALRAVLPRIIDTRSYEMIALARPAQLGRDNDRPQHRRLAVDLYAGGTGDMALALDHPEGVEELGDRHRR